MNSLNNLVDRIRKYVQDNYVPGNKLPPIKEMAHLFNTSKNTASNALKILNYEGFLNITPRHGVFVADDYWKKAYPDMADWDSFIVKNTHVSTDDFVAYQRKHVEPSISNALGMNYANSAVFDSSPILDSFRNLYSRIADDPELLNRQYRKGVDTLKVNICRYMADRHHAFVKPEQVILTTGVINSISTIAAALFRRGTKLIGALPTWVMNSCIDSYGVNFVRIPTDDKGMAVPHLLNAISKNHNNVLHICPLNAYPTGLTTGIDRRKELVRICKNSSTPIIEVDQYSNLTEQSSPSVLSMDETNSVIFVGAFSKLLPIGLRMGWIVAPPTLVNLITDVQSRFTHPTNITTQLVVDDLFTSGGFDKYVRALNGYLQHAAIFTERIMRRHIGEFADWDEKGHPMTFWIKFKKPVAPYTMLKLGLTPGIIFGVNDCAGISKSWFTEEEFETKMKTLSMQLREL